MMYYILGYTAFHPLKMATLAAVAVAILATLWHMSWMMYIRSKLLRLFTSICNIGDILGLPEDELFKRAATAAKASKGG